MENVTDEDKKLINDSLCILGSEYSHTRKILEDTLKKYLDI